MCKPARFFLSILLALAAAWAGGAAAQPACDLDCEGDATCAGYMREAEGGSMSATYLAAARLYQMALERCMADLPPEMQAEYSRLFEQSLGQARELGWQGEMGASVAGEPVEAFVSYSGGASRDGGRLSMVTVPQRFTYPRHTTWLASPDELRRAGEHTMQSYASRSGYARYTTNGQDGHITHARNEAEAALAESVRYWQQECQQNPSTTEDRLFVVLDAGSGGVVNQYPCPRVARKPSRPGVVPAN